VFQKFMNILHYFLRWTHTAEAVFVFRYMLLSILLWLPAVFKSSAHFYYTNKGIWALIMAQTILTVYAGDQMYNYVIRIGGTFLGLIMGLLIWYIGNANGNGNPYGLAASYAVLIIPVMFVRLFAPPVFARRDSRHCHSGTHHRILMDRWPPTSTFRSWHWMERRVA